LPVGAQGFINKLTKAAEIGQKNGKEHFAAEFAWFSGLDCHFGSQDRQDRQDRQLLAHTPPTGDLGSWFEVGNEGGRQVDPSPARLASPGRYRRPRSSAWN